MANRIEFFRGDGHTLSLTITQNGSALDITGYTVWFTVKENNTDTDANALISKTVTSHTNPTAGETSVELTASDTDITVGTHFYDIQIQGGSGEPFSVSGRCEVKQDITQASN